MFDFKKLQLRGGFIATVLLGGLFLLTGCGEMGRSPLVSTPGSSTQAAPQTAEKAQWSPKDGYLVFSKQAVRSLKPAILDSESGLYYLEEEKEFNPTESGSMEIDFEQPPGGLLDVRVRNVKFSVSANSIGSLPPLENGNYLITMKAISGTSLAHVAVQFGPSGLTFVPNAVLEIKLLGTLDPTALGDTAYHISGDGTVTLVPMTVTPDGLGWKISVEVPGFSQYSLGGDE